MLKGVKTLSSESVFYNSLHLVEAHHYTGCYFYAKNFVSPYHI